MKITYALTAVFAMTFFFAFSPDSNAQEWARKMFNEFDHDFGTVARGADVEHRFEIVNLYKEDIRIRDVKTSCGCTIVSLTKNVLKQGEKGFLVAKFNTSAFTGNKKATLTVRFGPSFVGEVQVNVKGNIRGDVQFEPGSVEFQQFVQGSSNGKSIRITKFQNRNWRIVDVKSTFKYVRVQMTDPRVGQNSVGYDMTIRLAEDVPLGFINGELFVVAQEYGRRVEIPIRFSAKVVSALQISPSLISINSKGAGDVFRKKIIVKAASPFRITDVICSDRRFEFSADPKVEKKIHFVDMVFTGDETTGQQECHIKFVTDFEGNAAGVISAVVATESDGE